MSEDEFEGFEVGDIVRLKSRPSQYEFEGKAIFQGQCTKPSGSNLVVLELLDDETKKQGGGGQNGWWNFLKKDLKHLELVEPKKTIEPLEIDLDWDDIKSSPK